MPYEPIALPIYICHDRKSMENSKHKVEETVAGNGSSVFLSRGVSNSDRPNPKSSTNDGDSGTPRRNEHVNDEVAIRAVISILSGYIDRYIKDESFRVMIKEKIQLLLSEEKI
ncbi:hypothetical protein V6N13_037867 [Hibiscus sabdariffa]